MELTRQYFDKQIKSLKSEMTGEFKSVRAEMATKKDLSEVKGDLDGVRDDLAVVKATMATKDDLLALREEIGNDIDNAVDELARVTNGGFLEQDKKIQLALDEQTLITQNSVEELARMTQAGFEDVLERLDVRERVTVLEKDIKHVKSVIKIK